MSVQIPPGTDLSKVPLGVNPNGSPPNFVDPPNLIASVQGVGISLAVTTFVLLCIRLRVYIKLNRGLVIDDGACKLPQNMTVRLIVPVFLIISFTLAVIYTVLASTCQFNATVWRVIN
jgi:hypothetical protein